MIDPGLTVSPAKRLALLNLLALLTTCAVNIGLILLNVWMVEEYGFNVPLFPLIMIGTALGCVLFWVWCASRLHVERATIRRCAVCAALPWWGFGTLVLTALILSLLTAEDGMKPAGSGLLNALGLVAGTVCFATHLIAAKPRTPKPQLPALLQGG